MDRAAPPSTPSLADRCTGALRDTDRSVNALHDALNARLPRLWWPLQVPSTAARLGAAEHALYAVHAGLALSVVLAVAPRRLRGTLVLVGAGGAVASWAIFSGAWDRRADARDAAWDAYQPDADYPD